MVAVQCTPVDEGGEVVKYENGGGITAVAIRVCNPAMLLLFGHFPGYTDVQKHITLFVCLRRQLRRMN